MTGSLMLDLAGLELTPGEKALLAEPEVGGVILFSRNFESCRQLGDLTNSIRALRPDILLAVDQEGGRVQRFRSGFTRLPAMARFGDWYDRAPDDALNAAHECGWLLATELLQFGIDFSFAPVLDLRYHDATVIGDRAFHHDADTVAKLASALTRGMAEAGMAAVGKHFPGHGFVTGDTHIEMPSDDRSLPELMAADMRPFQELIGAGLQGLMPAHVVYPGVDSRPAGFSKVWLQDVLRRQLGFTGTIFSDDLSMAAAGVAGTPQARACAALEAGCDMVLVCNDAPAARQVLGWLKTAPPVQTEPDPNRRAGASLVRQCSVPEARARTETARFRHIQQLFGQTWAIN